MVLELFALKEKWGLYSQKDGNDYKQQDSRTLELLIAGVRGNIK